MKDASNSYRCALTLCLLLAGCEGQQFGRVSVFESGCKGWATEGISITQEKTDSGLRCVIELKKPQ